MPLNFRAMFLATIFAAAVLPLAGSFLLFSPDERHYGEAAVQMVQGGELLTPRAADGALRLHKPILTYWTAAAGFELFGVTALGLRVGFVLAGGLVVFLTWRFARQVADDDAAAQTAALIMLSNVWLILTAIRATPDILLCLFMLISAMGAIELAVICSRSWWAPWALYLGAGFAVATKGLLPLVFVSYAVVFALVQPCSQRTGGSGLWHAPSIVAGLVVAGAWYGLMIVLHSHAALGAFWHDQVGGRVGGGWVHVAAQAGSLALALPISFFPWSLPLVGMGMVDRPAFIAADAVQRRFGRFFLGWVVLLVVVFALGSETRSRYLLPAAPLAAVWLANVYRRARPELLDRMLRGVLVLLLLVLAAFGGLLAWADWQMNAGGRAVVVATCTLAVVGVVPVARLLGRRPKPAIAIGLMILALAPIGHLGAGPIFLPASGSQIARALALHVPDATNRTVVYVGAPAMATQIRLCAAGRYEVQHRKDLDDPIDPQAVVVGPTIKLDSLDVGAYRIHMAARRLGETEPLELIRAIVRNRLLQYAAEQSEVHLIAVPRDGQ